MIVDRLRDAPRWMREGEHSTPAISNARQKNFDEVRELALRRIQIEGELRQAIEAPELELHYQPIINLQTGMLGGYEALMRWTHPERGFISPGEFIPLAEETGMIIEMGRWALEKGLSDHLTMLEAFAKGFPARSRHSSVSMFQAGNCSSWRKLTLCVVSSRILALNRGRSNWRLPRA